jgi:hypothetical protein
VPDDAERGRYDVPLSATADAHFVEGMDDGTVVVRPANATPTPTYVGGPAGTESPMETTGTPTSPRTTGAPSSSPTPHSDDDRHVRVPGFGVGGAVAAAAVLLVLVLARTDRR